MRKGSILLLLVLMLVTLVAPVSAIAPPGSYQAPNIYNETFQPTWIELTASYPRLKPRDPASLTAKCKVTWDYRTLQKYVYLYVDGTKYQMTYNSGTGYYERSVNIEPTAHDVRIQAKAVFDPIIMLVLYDNVYSQISPSDRAGDDFENGYSFGTVTSYRSVRAIDWIEPDSDVDWFYVSVPSAEYQMYRVTVTIYAYSNNIDSAFKFYPGYPGIFPPGWEPGDPINFPPMGWPTDNYGQGYTESYTQLWGWVTSPWIYIEVYLGSTGGYGGYVIDVTFSAP